jgi:hypothetical protein
MKNVVEMGSGAVMYIPSFMKTASGFQNVTGLKRRQHGGLISLFILSSLSRKAV